MRVASSEPNSFRIEPSGSRRFAAQTAGKAAQPGHLQAPSRRSPAAPIAGGCGSRGRPAPAGCGNCFASSRDAQSAPVIAPAGAAALEHQGRRRDLPALVQRPDEVFLRHHDVLEKHLVEMPVAVEQHERAHGDPRRLHIDQQIADAVVLRRVGVGAHQEETPVGEMRARGPDLLPVDDEMVALVDGAGAQTGEIGAGARPGIALTPDLVARRICGR